MDDTRVYSTYIDAYTYKARKYSRRTGHDIRGFPDVRVEKRGRKEVAESRFVLVVEKSLARRGR